MMDPLDEPQRAALQTLAPLVAGSPSPSTMLTERGMELGAALEAYQRKYVTEDIGHVVRSLVYFADAESDPLPQGLTEERWARIQEDLRRWVREI